VYPEHGVSDFTKLDAYIDCFAATGAKVAAALTSCRGTGMKYPTGSDFLE
jgi:hypothetical protein